MDRDREFCKKHCKGYQELGRCIVDGVCENYSKHHPEEQDYSSRVTRKVYTTKMKDGNLSAVVTDEYKV